MVTKTQMQHLAKLCTIRVGGEAKVFIPRTYDELQAFIIAHHPPYFFSGLGSNTIFSNNVKSTIIKTYKLTNIAIDNGMITADTGVSLHKLAQFARQHNIRGAKWLESIPGTVGGALKMNAGCFGYTFWENVTTVILINTQGEIYTKLSTEFTAGYRILRGLGSDEFFLSCTLAIDRADITTKELNKRYKSQPIGTANCGSVFKNPPGYYAAKLIEDAGLKGFRLGGAHISTKHANFIINDNHASSTDVIDLIKHIQQVVWHKYHLYLEPEVIIH